MGNGRYLLLICCVYVVTVVVEAAILVVGLSRRHSIRTRVFAAVWLNACTYPIVWLLIPSIIDPKTQKALYQTVSEIFAPVAECLLFYLAFERPRINPITAEREPAPRHDMRRDMAAIVIANLASLAVGLFLQEFGVWSMLF